MIKMFVGSSSESQGLAKKIAARIAQEIPLISPMSWQDALIPGNYTLSALIDAAERYQLALLLLRGEDIVRSRDEDKPAPRDNIVLEAGLFLSRLGPRRVGLVVEEAIKFPSDISGLIYARFSATWSERKIVAEVTKQLVSSWRPVKDPAHLGIEKTLHEIERRSAVETEGLYFPDPEAQRPVIIDSRPCTRIYRDGLNRVTERFWTTSFLTSEFWTGTEVDIILRANRHMLRKLSAHRDGSARRLFLLPTEQEQYLLEKKAEVGKFRHSKNGAAIHRMKSGVTNLRRNVQRMNEDGFETRVVCETGSRASHELMHICNVQHRPEDTELAIYDDFRVDLYSGGAKGITDQVVCFFEGVRDFESILTASEDYFEQIWRRGESALEFLRLYEDAVYSAAQEIDYTPNWLVRYDYRLSKADEALKAEELDKATEFITSHFSDTKIARYLDIGSCTGRYPIELVSKRLFEPSPTIIALENDPDAFVLMKAKLRMPGFEEEFLLIKPQRGDFMFWDAASHPGKFNLVTCMLGTISHLAAPGPQGDSRLLAAVQKMAASLTADGVLVIGCWSEQAIDREDFLAIYTPHDKLLLAKWSPSRDDMMTALRQCGLRFTVAPFAGRMDLYFCMPEGAANPHLSAETVSPAA